MKHTPILFSTEMVQSTLDLRKKMTRRTKGLEVINLNPGQWRLTSENKHICKFYSGSENNPNPIEKFWIFEHKLTGDRQEVKCPYGVVRDIKEKSDILWVRESFVPDYFDNHAPGYKADWTKTSAEYVTEPKWKPSIHMPKSVCRIFLRVTDVRIERLHDISDQDAVDEGIKSIFRALHHEIRYADYLDPESTWGSPRLSFLSLWAKINGQQSWDDNPWVWVVSFERCEKPEDFIK